MMAYIAIFDLDDTLFTSEAKIKVLLDGRVVSRLTPSEYNKYVLLDNEQYDFSEFISSEIFNRTAKPIRHVIDLFMCFIESGTDVCIVTAREDLDNKETFLETFRNHGIDIDKAHVHRAGNIGFGPAAKKQVIDQLLSTQKYNSAFMFDDHKGNLEAFQELNTKYTEIEFKPIYVDEEGKLLAL